MTAVVSKAKNDPLTGASTLCRLSSAELAQGYRSKSFSPVEVVRDVLARAETINPRYSAFTMIDHESALEDAAQSEARWMKGEPLSMADGIPSTIKDIVWVEGRPISYGSKAVAPVVPNNDCPAVHRLRRAGAVIIGLTTTPEFGWKAVTDSPVSGITRNPWNDELTSGGSSGGAAVAAATGAGVFHLGTDGGGSIRIPAAFTGIVGHKPTFGRVATYPPSPFGTLANIGPMTRDVASAKAMLDIIAGRDPNDWYQAPTAASITQTNQISFRGMRIGYWGKPVCGELDTEISAKVSLSAQQLEAEGAIIEDIELPKLDLLRSFNILWLSSVVHRIRSIPLEYHSAIDPDLLKAINSAKDYSAADYVAAQLIRVEFGRWMDELLARYDFVLSPAVAIAPFSAGHQVPPESIAQSWVEWAGFNFPLNLSQHPACVIPCDFMGDGRPIGLQIIGARGADHQVLAVALTLEGMRLS